MGVCTCAPAESFSTVALVVTPSMSSSAEKSARRLTRLEAADTYSVTRFCGLSAAAASYCVRRQKRELAQLEPGCWWMIRWLRLKSPPRFVARCTSQLQNGDANRLGPW